MNLRIGRPSACARSSLRGRIALTAISAAHQAEAAKRRMHWVARPHGITPSEGFSSLTNRRVFRATGTAASGRRLADSHGFNNKASIDRGSRPYIVSFEGPSLPAAQQARNCGMAYVITPSNLPKRLTRSAPRPLEIFFLSGRSLHVLIKDIFNVSAECPSVLFGQLF